MIHFFSRRGIRMQGTHDPKIDKGTMNTIPTSTNTAGQLFNSFREELVPCELCEALTTMTATKRCDRCWELEKRIRRDPDLAKQIIKLMEAE